MSQAWGSSRRADANGRLPVLLRLQVAVAGDLGRSPVIAACSAPTGLCRARPFRLTLVAAHRAVHRLGPIQVVSREDPDTVTISRHEPKAVMLDLVHPLGSGRDFSRRHREFLGIHVQPLACRRGGRQA